MHVMNIRWDSWVAGVAVMCALSLFACEKRAEQGSAEQAAPAKAANTGEATDKAASGDEGGAAPTAAPTAAPSAAPTAAATDDGSAGSGPEAALSAPSKATAQAPETFKARFTTTKGDFVIEATRAWAPRGVDRLYNLIAMGYFKDVALFRVVSGFVVQFGIHGTPDIAALWSQAEFPDDPVTQSNTPGTLVFATAGPNTRTTQLFINLGKNDMLDEMGFAPIAKVIEGMEVVTTFYTGYGDGPPRGAGPDQGRMAEEGNTYLKADFPELDYILQAVIVE